MKWLKAHRAKILIILAALLILFSINFFGRTSQSAADRFKNFFYLISSPVQKVLWGAGDSISDFFSAIYKAKALQKENIELLLKNQQIAVDNMQLLALKQENQVLRQALALELKKDFKLIFSQIIGKDIGQDFLLLNKGLKDNVSEGFPVITQEKVLCGRISKVYHDFSRMELYSNKNLSFDVKVLVLQQENLPEPSAAKDEKNTVAAVAKGKGNLKIFLELLPQEELLKEGNLIFTTSLSNIFPANLLVGQIKKLIKSDVEPFYKAEVKPSCDIGDIEHLFIATE